MASPHTTSDSTASSRRTAFRDPPKDHATIEQPSRKSPFVSESSASHTVDSSSPAHPSGPLLPSPFPREPAEPSPTADASHDLHLYSNFIRPTSAIAASTSSLHNAVRHDLAQRPTLDDPALHPIHRQQTADDSQLQLSNVLSTELPPPPANFSPFFTLIKDTTSGEYIHPSVYYVFADDEPEVVTTAALHALETDEMITQAHTGPSQDQHGREDLEVEDRYILLDLDASGTTITHAQSLSSQWAVMDSRLEAAPVFGGQIAKDKQDPERNSMMLVVEGMSSRAGNSKGKQRAEHIFEDAKKEVQNTAGEADSISTMGRLHADMEGRMAMLDKVMAGLGTRS